MLNVEPNSIATTHDLIKPFIRFTPTIDANGEDFGISPCRITLKLEHLNTRVPLKRAVHSRIS